MDMLSTVFESYLNGLPYLITTPPPNIRHIGYSLGT